MPSDHQEGRLDKAEVTLRLIKMINLAKPSGQFLRFDSKL